jgi:hypothetical protein
MGTIINGHGILYNREYGWPLKVESLLAKVTTDFINNYDPQSEPMLDSQARQDFLCCVVLVKDRLFDGRPICVFFSSSQMRGGWDFSVAG